MRLFSKIGRRLASLALVGVTVAAAVTALASPAAAANAWWKFQNEVTNECLTGGNGTAYVTGCVIGADSQEWDWLDDGQTYKRLRNHATGLCLVTRIEADRVNAVWTTGCTAGATAQEWYFSSNLLQSDLIGVLRTSPTRGAVYTDNDIFNSRAKWDGWVTG